MELPERCHQCNRAFEDGQEILLWHQQGDEYRAFCAGAKVCSADFTIDTSVPIEGSRRLFYREDRPDDIVFLDTDTKGL